MSSLVLCDIHNDVARVTLNRPDKRNGLSRDLTLELIQTAKKLAKNRELRAVIISGEGEVFCSGLDFASWGKKPSKMLLGFLKPVSDTNLFQEVAWCWRKLQVPVVAVTHGVCFGGGLQIALGADFRFSTPDCQFSIMEAKWGLIPDMTGTVTLRELMPMDKAKELTMTGRIFDAIEAKALNLVTGISENPMDDAEALVAEIVTRSPDSVAATKALFHKTWAGSESKALRQESILQAKLLLGRNHGIARKANMANKLPDFVRRRFDY
jgi:enoyl-CoA hydratase/carnithine racemase